MSHKYCFMVQPFKTIRSEVKPTLFIYETVNNDEDSQYTADNIDKDRENYWNGWLERSYDPPFLFVNRFGYSSIDAGPLKSEEHFKELLREAGIVNTEIVDDNRSS